MSKQETWTPAQFREYAKTGIAPKPGIPQPMSPKPGKLKSSKSGNSDSLSKKKTQKPILSSEWVQPPVDILSGFGIFQQHREMGRIWIPEIGPTLNKGLAREKHSQRSRTARRFKALVQNAVESQDIKPIHMPVFIVFGFFFGKSARATDWVNCAYTAKCFEDGIVKAGILADDKKEFVKFGVPIPIKTHLDRSYTIAWLYESI